MGKIGFVRHKIIVSDPRIMGGTPCFAGTRVPVDTLLDFLEAGQTIDNFLDGFPTVRRKQVLEFLEAAASSVVAGARRREVAA